MSQCLRCSKPCETSAVFCDECRSLLRNEFRQGSVSRSSDSGGVASAVGTRFTASPSAPSLVAQESDADESKEDDPAYDNYHSAKPPVIVNTPRSPGAPITPHPPTLDSFTFQHSAEQTMSRLSEAAQFISEVEPSNRRLPRASRLAPIRDISADIRRESTPLPKLSKMRASTGASETVSVSGPLPAAREDMLERDFVLHDSNGGLPDYWPWLDNDIEEKENEDTWANSTDPLISRHIPNSVESAHIEEEDIKRALAEGMPTNHNLRLVKPRRASSLRIVFAVLAILAALALIVDGILFSVVVVHPRRANALPNGPAVAALTLSPSIVNIAKTRQTVQVHIMNFSAGHNVHLWHDFQESVVTVGIGGSSTVTIGKDGSAQATIIVDDTWGVPFDQVYAEDIATHFVASAQLQVIGKNSSKPAHLKLLGPNGIAITSLDFGSDIQGSNKILPLALENSGSGSITWSASSNQPWLLVSPGQGIFSQNQNIVVAAQRAHLTSGKHTGTLTISTNVGSPQTITATVYVTGLSSNVGPVLAPTPAVLSFTTTDGSPAPPAAQILTLNNPGTQPLDWSLTMTPPASPSNQLALAHMSGISSNWLSATLVAGTLQTIQAGSSQQLRVSVISNSLLPGAYQGYLVFSASKAVDSSQTVAVSLTVQPHCGLVTNSGSLSFTAVQGKTNPSNQSLGLNATASCAGASINWKAALSSLFNWLSATPTSGTLIGTTSEFISVGANATGLQPGSYYGFIALTTKMPTNNSTQTVMVSLTVQPPPAQPNAPVMSAAPLNLNFSNTQGQPNPKGQVVTITNTGGSMLNWSTNVLPLGRCWLCAFPSGGRIQSNSSGQLIVSVDTSSLSPGTYAGQITLNGTDSTGKTASGSGQVVSINLVVQPACTLTQPSSSSLAFSGVQGGFNPISQSLLITGTGNCAWPLTLTASVPTAPWLSVQFPTSNKVNGSGQSVVFVVRVSMNGLISGPPISANFTISATDSAGTIATGSPQQISATLTVSPPCLPVVASALNFTAAQGPTSPISKSVLLSETGSCSRPVSWTAVVETNSPWLTLSSPQPDNGSGSPLIVSVNSSGLQAGTQTGRINLTATDSSGYAVGSSQTITVTLTVTPTFYSVSGTVVACTGLAPVCLTPVALPGATLALFDSTNKQVASAIADGSGNYMFTNLSPGNYTINISGTLSSVNYSAIGTVLVVTSNITVLTLNTW